MTLGEKIRKYRLLRGLTQQELGEAVGFKKSTADVRINQYESNKIAPKAVIREAIADVLDIDISALSNVEVTSFEDVMYILFELEEKYGMKIAKGNGTTSLTFDDNNKNIATLISYMNLWQMQRAAMSIDNLDTSDDVKRDYMLWQGGFKSNIEAYYKIKKEDIDKHYEKAVSDLSCSKYAIRTSEITRLICRIIEAGISVSTNNRSFDSGNSAPGFTFAVNELIDPISEDAENLFAKFLYEYNHFQELGAGCFTEMQLPGKIMTITYHVRVSSFSVITSRVNTFLEYKEKKVTQGDFYKDSFEVSFKSDLEKNNKNIKDEIRRSIK